MQKFNLCRQRVKNSDIPTSIESDWPEYILYLCRKILNDTVYHVSSRLNVVVLNATSNKGCRVICHQSLDSHRKTKEFQNLSLKIDQIKHCYI